VEKQWSKLSPPEKRAQRFNRWISPPQIKFSSPQAATAYRERSTRMMKALLLEKPDRVPVQIPTGSFPAYNAGTDLHTVMYDYQELRRAWKKFIIDIDSDVIDGAGFAPPGKAYDLMDFKMYRWPGHGISKDTSLQQFVEDEYLKADEYDIYLNNSLDFALRYFLPRTLGTFESFQKMPPFSSASSLPMRIMGLSTVPEVRAAFKAIADAGEELARYQAIVGQCNREAQEDGYPMFTGGMAVAPFDHFADSLRGTRGIATDMYRQPDKLLEAMEKVTPNIIQSAIASADVSGCPIILMPLHKGDDSFMSDKQYEVFYWPTLKKVFLGLYNEGLVPIPIADGSYNRRLEVIKDVPRSSVAWIFEQTDMFKAKEVLGGWLCIAGNVTGSLLRTGTSQDVKNYCRKLIEVCGKDGGYILGLGASIDKCPTENLKAIVSAAKEYGVYSK
jgi:uroporphyrinogen-III decarboxylase